MDYSKYTEEEIAKANAGFVREWKQKNLDPAFDLPKAGRFDRLKLLGFFLLALAEVLVIIQIIRG